jgi:hypothetical protein
MTFFFQSYEQRKVSFLKYVFIYFRILVWHVFKCVSLRIIQYVFCYTYCLVFCKRLKSQRHKNNSFWGQVFENKPVSSVSVLMEFLQVLTSLLLNLVINILLASTK